MAERGRGTAAHAWRGRTQTAQVGPTTGAIQARRFMATPPVKLGQPIASQPGGGRAEREVRSDREPESAAPVLARPDVRIAIVGQRSRSARGCPPATRYPGASKVEKCPSMPVKSIQYGSSWSCV